MTKNGKIRIFVTSDLHLGHNNIIKYCNRPFSNVEEMNNTIIDNWNKTVNKKDSVYILGDLGFTNVNLLNETMNLLNGKKYLIRGNHDHFIKKKGFDMSNFEWIKDYFLLTTQINNEKVKFIMSHFPFYTWDSKHYGSIHLYGHVHNSNLELNTILGNAFNVGVDVNGFKPVELDYIYHEIKRRNNG